MIGRNLMKFLIGTFILIWLSVLVVFCYSALVVDGKADRMEDDLFDQYLREQDEKEID